VERVEEVDRISGNHFTTRYSYHHGFFDGFEREFCGFARVEQWDYDQYAIGDLTASGEAKATWDVPMSHTKTWFHTGFYTNRKAISAMLAQEYFVVSNDIPTALEDTVLPGNLDDAQQREACRALKGQALRSEVYGGEGSPDSEIPYNVQESNFTIVPLQLPQDAHGHGIFFVHGRESMSIGLERRANDPRIGHNIILDVDSFGNVLKSMQVSYGRRPNISTLSEPSKSKQETLLIAYSEYDFTNWVDGDDDYRLPAPYQTRQYEITGLKPKGGERFSFDSLAANAFSTITSIAEVPFESDASTTDPQKRLLKRSRILYRKDDLTGLLPAGKLERLALPGSAYDMAFTPGIISTKFQRKDASGAIQNLLSNPSATMAEAGYVDLDGDGHWWKTTRSVYFSPGISDTAAQELVTARSSFFSPQRMVSPFKEVSFVTYDKYFMFPVLVKDAVGNTRKAEMDYRVLQSTMVIDENGNRSATAFDAMGLVTGTASMGETGENLGDNLDSFRPQLSQDEINQFFNTPTTAVAVSLLGNAGTRVIYDYGRYYRNQGKPNPVFTATISRETHSSDPLPPNGLRVQLGFAYTDGAGRTILKKEYVDPGPLVDKGPIVSTRWVGKGWTIFNSKGKPVKSYESFFDNTHDFKFDPTISVCPIILYDPLSRVAATLQADHTIIKALFEPWVQSGFDVNDNVKLSNPRNDPDIGHLLKGLPEDTYFPSWYDLRISGAKGADEQAAAVKAALHANTPQVHHLDVMGRSILTIDDNGGGKMFTNTVDLDIRGAQIKTTDALGRVAVRFEYNVAGDQIHKSSMDAGDDWSLSDVLGKAFYTWNSRGIRFRSTYDAVRRPTELWASDNGGPENLFENIIYGEDSPDALANNLRGKEWRVLDQAGMSENRFDFKGNAISSSRQLSKNYKVALDLSSNPALEEEVFTNTTTFDAMNRPTLSVATDSSVIYRTYNQMGLPEKIFLNNKGESTSSDPNTWTPIVTKTDYNAKGQTILSASGNGVTTTSTFDPLMFRLQRLQRLRGSDSLQDLNYTYDPASNITSISDNAQKTIFFRNARVDARSECTYDATYRLLTATGREHLGQTGGVAPGPADAPSANGDNPDDGTALAGYEEKYSFDPVGNLLQMKHSGSDPRSPGWTRSYAYDAPSALEPGKKGDRLTSTSVSASHCESFLVCLTIVGQVGATTDRYTYDDNGNMVSMPHLRLMQWDFKNQLHATSKQTVSGDNTPEMTYYVYNSKGERIRKVTERQAGIGSTSAPTKLKERIYLASFEWFRTFDATGDAIALERSTLRVNQGNLNVANVEIRTKGTDDGLARITRYQCPNHLGSVSLELDETARLISYEEFFPFGSTSYQAVASNVDVPKRYRYSGKEKDDENGLYYYGARYYASWLGRWTAPDPSSDGTLLYIFVRNNPLRYVDPDGRAEEPPWVWQFMKNGMGTLAHAIVLGAIAARIDALPGTPYLAGIEVATKPGGTKANMGKTDNLSQEPGKMDIVLGIVPLQNPGSVFIHIYELRSVTGFEGIDQKKAETEHYSGHTPATLFGRQVVGQGPGTVLTQIVAEHPQVLAPIIHREGRFEFRIDMWLARDKNKAIVPGVILYKISARIRDDDDAEEVELSDTLFDKMIKQEIVMERTTRLMQVNLRSTVGSEAIMGQRVAGWGTMGVTIGSGIAAGAMIFGGEFIVGGATIAEGGTLVAGGVATETAVGAGGGLAAAGATGEVAAGSGVAGEVAAGAGGKVLQFVPRAAKPVADVVKEPLLKAAAALLYFFHKNDKGQ
jgi:RHS repeat-associated protein